jgi:hypothetical protein
MAERLDPDELWELFQRVVPQVPTRPQGSGRSRYGDREELTAIVRGHTTYQILENHLPTATVYP